MPVIPLNPYVADVAMALSIASWRVVETWTEPVEPPDHVISLDAPDGANIHLVWDGTWRWFRYPPTGTRATFPYVFAGPTTGRLDVAGDASPDSVVEAVAAVVTR